MKLHCQIMSQLKIFLDSIDWSKFKEITEQMLKALQEKIEKACEELRALLGLNENDEPLDTTAMFQNAIDGWRRTPNMQKTSVMSS